MRTVLAVVANTKFFQKMRSALDCDDFEDKVARDLFIALEECYRAEAIDYDSILKKCPTEELKNAVTNSVMQGEFAMNAEQIVEDGIRFIKMNGLKNRRKQLLARLSYENASQDNGAITDLLIEIRNLDEQLKKLKGN